MFEFLQLRELNAWKQNLNIQTFQWKRDDDEEGQAEKEEEEDSALAL